MRGIRPSSWAAAFWVGFCELGLKHESVRSYQAPAQSSGLARIGTSGLPPPSCSPGQVRSLFPGRLLPPWCGPGGRGESVTAASQLCASLLGGSGRLYRSVPWFACLLNGCTCSLLTRWLDELKKHLSCCLLTLHRASAFCCLSPVAEGGLGPPFLLELKLHLTLRVWVLLRGSEGAEWGRRLRCRAAQGSQPAVPGLVLLLLCRGGACVPCRCPPGSLLSVFSES